MKSGIVAIAVAASLASVPASAIDETAILACRAIADEVERLACYDREVDSAARIVPESEPPAAAAATQNAEERFGRERAIAHEERKKERQRDREFGELVATVTGIETRVDGLMTVTLDNGQVWRQSRPDSLFRLKIGDQIRIQPAALNSYLLSGPSKRSTRVSRVR